MTTSPKKKKAYKLLLLMLVIFLISFAYKKSNDYNDLKQIFINDKKELQQELDQITANYKKLSVKNKKLSRRIIKEINTIIYLKDSVNKLDANSYKLLRKYRKRVSELQKHNRELLVTVDSLNTVNANLRKDNNVVKKNLIEKDEIATKLTKQNSSLAKINQKLEAQIEPAKKILISNVNAVAMRSKSSGKLTATTKSNRADAFKITFKLLKNEVTKSGNKTIHVQVKDTKNNVIAIKKEVQLKNGQKIECSDEIIANYKNQELEVLSLVLLNRDNINEGNYKINIFIDGYFTSSSVITLD